MTGKINASTLGRIIKYNNARCVCPPGKLLPGDGKPIIVATLMRSGTHVLIDSLLNNCRSLRRCPLYVDLDQMFLEYGTADAYKEIAATGGCIVKSHFPQLSKDKHAEQEAILRIAEIGSVVTVTRDLEAIKASFELFSGGEESPDISATHEEFTSFWGPLADVELRFEDLLTNWEDSMSRVGQVCQLRLESKLKPPISKSKIRQAHVDKLLTRLLGYRAPTINTTIGFAIKKTE